MATPSTFSSSTATLSRKTAGNNPGSSGQTEGQTLYQEISESHQPEVVVKRQFEQRNQNQKTQLANDFIASAGREGINHLASTPEGQHALAVVYKHASGENRGFMLQLHKEQGNTAVDYTRKSPVGDTTPQPTSLLTERLHDGEANCLERATLGARDGQNIVFLRDNSNLDGDNAGHTLIRDMSTGKVWDPTDGDPPADPTEWKYSGVDDWRQQQGRLPGGHSNYTLDADIPANVVQRVLSAEPGADRKVTLNAIKTENPEVSAKLEAMAANRYARIKPEDVAIEMRNQTFKLSQSVGTAKAGDQVVVTDWNNSSSMVTVRSGSNTFIVPKTALRPTRPTGSTLAPYSMGVEAQAKVVEKAEKARTDLLAKQSEYKSPAAKKLFQAELMRQEGLLKKRRATLNRKLIQETMFNRFDLAIQKSVAEYNHAHGLKGKDALDPNLVKSMLYQESQLGTAGTHLENPPSHPVKTRFNLGQVIDSSGLALLTKLERDQSGTLNRDLPGMRADLQAAQRELRDLKKKSSLTPTEQTRVTELKRLSTQNWEQFIWSYRSPHTNKTFSGVVNSYFQATSPPRNESYDFWIDSAVMWLGKKHTSGRSWPETIRHYNGGGSAATQYMKEVVHRAQAARDAQNGSVPFQPSGS
jgi:hypothetical protein